MACEDEDQALACYLQMLYDAEDAESLSKAISQTPPAKNSKKLTLVDEFWELNDPNPNIHALFLQFDREFFWGKLKTVEVRWSPRMTLCAGVCSYEGRGGLCSIRLSQPLLKLRPRKDLIETLLHEMIHAYLFVTHNNKDHNDHGPEFHKHMYRINKEAGTRITVYHDFHDEVDSYRQHWWRCTGPCQKRRPFFGFVKRAMNRAPSPRDPWWSEHAASCSGTFIKVREPQGYSKKSKSSSKENLNVTNQMSKEGDIRNYLGRLNGAKVPNRSSSSSSSSASAFSFGSHSSGTTKDRFKTPSDPGFSSNVHTFGMFGDPEKLPSHPAPAAKPYFTPFSGAGHKLGSVEPKKFPSPAFRPGFKSVASKRSVPGGAAAKSSSSQNISATRLPKERRIDDMFGRLPTPKTPSRNKTITIDDVFDSSDESSRTSPPRPQSIDESFSASPRSLMVNCPACGRSVRESEINSHLDDCLST